MINIKSIFCGIFLTFLFSGLALASDTVTVFGTKHVKTNFSLFGLYCDLYPDRDLLNIDADKEAKIAESIKKSRLVLFGDMIPAKALAQVFSSEIIKESLKNLLERGGIIFVSRLDWTILGKLPKSMTDFFKEVGGYMYNQGNYKSERPERLFDGIANHKIKHSFTSKPNKLSSLGADVKANIYIGGAVPIICKPLVIDKKKGYPLILLEEGIMGEGKIILSQSCNVISGEVKHKFIENVVKYLYGNKKPLTAKQKFEQKIGKQFSEKNETSKTSATADGGLNNNVVFPVYTEFEKAIDGKYDGFWRNCSKLALSESKTGNKPEKLTEVYVKFSSKNLYILFLCYESDMKYVKTTTKTKDDNAVYNDDCVEFIIFNNKKQYHFTATARGTKWESKDRSIAWNPEYGAVAGKWKKGWLVEFCIPYSILSLEPMNNPVWKVNFCREEQNKHELSSWCPAPKGFENPNSSGYLSFLPKEKFKSYIGAKAGAKKERTGDKYQVWYKNPYTAIYADDVPNTKNEVKQLDITLGINEKECSSVLLTCFSETPLTFRIEPGELMCGGKPNNFSSLITLKEAVPRLNSFKQRQMDPIVKLNEGNLIVVPSYETRQLWLDIKGRLAPGQYTTTISFVPVDSLAKVKTVNISIRILPLEFPMNLPVFGYTYGPYRMTYAAKDGIWEAYIANLPEYHINYAYLPFPLKAIKRSADGSIIVSTNKDDYFTKIPVIKNGKTEYIYEELLMKKYMKGWFYSYGLFPELNARLGVLGIQSKNKKYAYNISYNELNISDEEYEKILIKWVSTWFRFLKEEGISFKDFYIPLCDEPQVGIEDKLLWVGNILKKISPEVQIHNNMAIWGSFENVVKKLDPIVDFWMPVEGRLTSPSEISQKELEFYKNNGKPFATYQCSESNVIGLPLLNYYRFRGIRGWLMKSAGIGLWANNSWRGNSWSEFDVIAGGFGDRAIFYHGDNGPIPSKRAESFREAFEDYYLLYLASKQSDTKLSELTSKELLEQLMANDNPDKVLEWRTKLLIRLSEININQNKATGK